MASAMGKRKPKNNSRDASSVAGVKAKQKEMTELQKHDMFSPAAIALVVAVFAAPLTAEVSTCKYSGTVGKRKVIAGRGAEQTGLRSSRLNLPPGGSSGINSACDLGAPQP